WAIQGQRSLDAVREELFAVADVADNLQGTPLSWDRPDENLHATHAVNRRLEQIRPRSVVSDELFWSQGRVVSLDGGDLGLRLMIRHVDPPRPSGPCVPR